MRNVGNRGRGNRNLQQTLLAPRRRASLPTTLPEDTFPPAQQTTDLPPRDFYPKLERWGGLDVHRFPSDGDDIFLRIAPGGQGVVLGSVNSRSSLVRLRQQDAADEHIENNCRDAGVIRTDGSTFDSSNEIRYRVDGETVHVAFYNSMIQDESTHPAFWKKQMPLEAWDSLLEDIYEIGKTGRFTDVLPQWIYRPTPGPLTPTSSSSLQEQLLRQR